MPSIWRAPAGTIPSAAAVQARAHPCGQSLPSSLTRPLSHAASLAERFRTLPPLIPHVATATMAQPQVRSASLQSQAPRRKQRQLRVRSRPSPPLRSYPVRPQRTRSRVPMTVDSCIMLHGCPPSPDAWGRLNVVTPFHHLSGDSHINSSLRAGPLRHLKGPPGGVTSGASFAESENPAQACVWGKGGVSGTLIVSTVRSAKITE